MRRMISNVPSHHVDHIWTGSSHNSQRMNANCIALVYAIDFWITYSHTDTMHCKTLGVTPQEKSLRIFTEEGTANVPQGMAMQELFQRAKERELRLRKFFQRARRATQVG
ncbi:hypothetical protein FRB95_012755 [Tulasnella sp. JGI-2019a]|nr:hypothetical protein FRB95_012755 [Tulasnella sp. JGI-2019a]